MFMTAVATPDAARLVFAAVAGLILLLILIIKFKVHAMISIQVCIRDRSTPTAARLHAILQPICATASHRATTASTTRCPTVTPS